MSSNKYNKNKRLSDIEAEEGDRNAPNDEKDSSEPDHKTFRNMPSSYISIQLQVQTGMNFALPDDDTVDPYMQINLIGESESQ